jgi:hypothetical protein
LSSAIWTLQEAMDAAIQGDGTLAPMLAGDKVYSLLGPSDAGVVPYVLLAQSAESRWAMFETPAFSGVEGISIFSADRSKKEVALIAAEVVRVLGAPLTLDGYNFVTGEVSILAITMDPSLKFSMASLSYEVMSHG